MEIKCVRNFVIEFVWKRDHHLHVCRFDSSMIQQWVLLCFDLVFIWFFILVQKGRNGLK